MKLALLKYFWLLLLVGVAFGDGEIVSTSRDVMKKVYVPVEKEQFSFVILGDCTGGDFAEGLEIMTQAVREINVLKPEFVFTVGDLIPGYNGRSEWMKQAREYRTVVKSLKTEWYPVAGNHDIYWRGEGGPKTEHEEDFERVFGPLWYSFEYKECLFVTLFSDEGDPVTGVKSFDNPACQKMTEKQRNWLKETLSRSRDARHVFLFLHHPRWKEGNYGEDWARVHDVLKEAGNVSAVFAGHDHTMRYYGKKDGIRYYTMGATGGGISEEEMNRNGHHYMLVNVGQKDYTATVVPVGHVRSAEADMVKMLKTKEKWFIQDKSVRKFEYPIIVENYGAKSVVLRIGVAHGADDSGDSGVWVYLFDDERKLLKEHFTKSKGREWVNVRVGQGKLYYVVIEDKDTMFNGRNPGNAGSIEIRALIKD